MAGKCGTCRFWEPDISHKPEVFEGECHIRAPQVVTDPDGATPFRRRHTVWPRTLHIDWCGEHEPKPIDKPDDTEGGA